MSRDRERSLVDDASLPAVTARFPDRSNTEASQFDESQTNLGCGRAIPQLPEVVGPVGLRFRSTGPRRASPSATRTNRLPTARKHRHAVGRVRLQAVFVTMCSVKSACDERIRRCRFTLPRAASRFLSLRLPSMRRRSDTVLCRGDYARGPLRRRTTDDAPPSCGFCVPTVSARFLRYGSKSDEEETMRDDVHHAVPSTAACESGWLTPSIRKSRERSEQDGPGTPTPSRTRSDLAAASLHQAWEPRENPIISTSARAASGHPRPRTEPRAEAGSASYFDAAVAANPS